ncbi:MAG: hypothetical protein IJP74_00005 [Prevotella sp.]|nr:hypothetical protein [Prevotella sp.]
MGGGLPTTESQVSLFQQYAYKRAADYAQNANNHSAATLLGNHLLRNGFQKGTGRERRRYIVARYQ